MVRGIIERKELNGIRGNILQSSDKLISIGLPIKLDFWLSEDFFCINKKEVEQIVLKLFTGVLYT